VLIVHVVAVLLPMAILASLALVAVRPTRRAFGLLTLAVGFIACVSVPLATLSGHALRARTGSSVLIDRHAHLAGQLLPVAAGFGLCLALFVAVDMVRRFRTEQVNEVEATLLRRLPRVRDYSRRHRLLAAHRIAAVLLVVTAVIAMVTVVRVGDSGAKAAWNGRLHATTQAP
jgi:hypothetical protein